MLAEQVKSRKKVEPKKFIKNEKNTEGIKKPKQKKRKRLIIRNLSFKVDNAELKKVFSEFGNVVDVQIPLKKDGKKKGFGFVEFDNTKSLIQAMKSMNYKEIKGRKVAVDFAVDKTTYQLKVQSLRQDKKASEKDDSESGTEEIKTEIKSEDDDSSEEEEEEDEDEKRLNDFLKEFDSGADALTKSKSPQTNDASDDSSDESSLEDSSDDESKNNEENLEVDRKSKRKFDEIQDAPSKKQKKNSQDVSEGKTVFIRNLSFTSTEDSLREALEGYGECEYCLICMDPLTDHAKGTAFIKFKEKSSADKLVEDSINESGIIVDGRKLSCSFAVSRDEISRLGNETTKPKDKRNLNLLRVGLIMPNTKESEGVSPSDMARRAQLEIGKKVKLKNVNFFVSTIRLIVHNLPTSYSDGDLRKLFKTAAGPGAAITEAKVMKEFKKTDADGKPLTKGFGFVTFTKHEDALAALKKLNNNPDVFTPQKRPIVEFSVENIVAIQSKERKKEKTQLRNKRRTEEKKERQIQQLKEDAEKPSNQKESSSKNKKKKNKQNKTDRKETGNVKKSEQFVNNQIPKSEENSPKNKKKKKGRSNRERKERKKAALKSRQTDVSDLVHKYKDKLKNKIT